MYRYPLAFMVNHLDARNPEPFIEASNGKSELRESDLTVPSISHANEQLVCVEKGCRQPAAKTCGK